MVDDQGLEAGGHRQNEAKMSKKHAKSARFESCAPIMPQNVPKKNPNKIPEKIKGMFMISSLYFCFDYFHHLLLKYKQLLDNNK